MKDSTRRLAGTASFRKCGLKGAEDEQLHYLVDATLGLNLILSSMLVLKSRRLSPSRPSPNPGKVVFEEDHDRIMSGIVNFFPERSSFRFEPPREMPEAVQALVQA